MTYRKKLIEVALPLDAINKESAREKPIRHGHPKTLHHWWSRKPLAACRAVLFASLVDDPGEGGQDLPDDEAKLERDRLFRIMEELVMWENLSNDKVLSRAHAEIVRSTGDNPPPILDPFCGGGSIPLEAQRLGLEAFGSDLNPVAVLLTKTLVEIPAQVAGQWPVNPDSRAKFGHSGEWKGAQGLAEDVRYYGEWMRDEAEKRIGHLYPRGPNGETALAWLHCRTVKCPNPVCGARMPLASRFWVSTKKGSKAWVEPLVDREKGHVHFEVRTGSGSPPEGTKQQKRSRCLFCGTDNITDAQLREQASTYGVGTLPLAVVAQRGRSRVALPAHNFGSSQVSSTETPWLDQPLPGNTRWFSPPGYGLGTYRSLFTPRQANMLATFSNLVASIQAKVTIDAVSAGLPDDDVPLRVGGTGARAYGEAVATYLGEAVSKLATFHNILAYWRPGENKSATSFGRQALAMTWDFAEINPFAGAGGDFREIVAKATPKILSQALPAAPIGHAKQSDARMPFDVAVRPVVSTDPPYYDNMGYADLSDFFYLWLRNSLKAIYPDIFGTMLAPKSQELVADAYRFGGDKERARKFFEAGLGQAFDRIRREANPDYPVTIYYAFKQAESQGKENNESMVSSTGWETMLDGVLKAGFQITGTWPLRTEMESRIVGRAANSLASSIVLVCRPRSAEAPPATRQEFVRALRRELPDALSVMMAENVAPVDLAQATIGPGMAIYSRYSKVVEADGSPMRVRTALQIINQVLDEYLSEAEGDVDSHTRFAITWFEQRGMEPGPYGDAESIATARNVSVRGVQDAGILEARGGKVRLLPRERLTENWDPATDARITDWEIVQHLIRALETEGETGAARLLARIGARAEGARDLSYRLYGICDRKGWAGEALAYNGLVMSWPEITKLAAENPSGAEVQTRMDV